MNVTYFETRGRKTSLLVSISQISEDSQYIYEFYDKIYMKYFKYTYIICVTYVMYMIHNIYVYVFSEVVQFNFTAKKHSSIFYLKYYKISQSWSSLLLKSPAQYLLQLFQYNLH